AKKDSQTGKWSFRPDTEWADGDYQLTVSVTDNAGNIATSDKLQLVIDTTVNKPGIALAVDQDTGHSATDNLTRQKQPTFTLSNIDGDAYEVMVTTVAGGKTESVAAKKDSLTGEWSFRPDTEWADGDYQLTVRVTDDAGNKATSDKLQVVIDTVVNKPGIALAVDQDTGHSVTDNLTSKKQPTFTLSNIDGDADEVMVTVTGGKTETVAAKKDSQTGEWSFSSDTEWADGDYQLTVRVT
ncbi:TPA: Ig-like domain repeat protein, partial [Yersinia enterocolitica]|nr:Ig-like domain repeat protein [Yersinia enterocolitica]